MSDEHDWAIAPIASNLFLQDGREEKDVTRSEVALYSLFQIFKIGPPASHRLPPLARRCHRAAIYKRPMPGYRLARAACFNPSRTSIHRFTIDRYVKVYRDDVRDAVQRNDGHAAAR